MVDRLLALSKLESLTQPAHPQTVSLMSLVQSQLNQINAPLAQRQLQIQWLQQDNTAQVRGDADALAMAVSNLLANALGFAPEGSTLELAVKCEDKQAVFTVRDHGPGVADYAVPRLGERFFSTPRPRDGSKGTGLGLAIVQQVMQLHGGSVAFEDAQPGLRVRVVMGAV
jgi:two-component system, OmpR family, sensor histidine kinase CreC